MIFINNFSQGTRHEGEKEWNVDMQFIERSRQRHKRIMTNIQTKTETEKQTDSETDQNRETK